MIDGATPIPLIVKIGIRRVDGNDRLDVAICSMNVCAHCLEGCVSVWATIQFVRDVDVQREVWAKICNRRVDLACPRNTAVGTVTLDPNKVEAVQRKTIEAESRDVRGCIGGNVGPAHYFIAHQGSSQRGYGIPGGGRPERPYGKFRGLRRKLKVPHRQ